MLTSSLLLQFRGFHTSRPW